MPSRTSNKSSTSGSGNESDNGQPHFWKTPDGDFHLPVYGRESLAKIAEELPQEPGIRGYALATYVLQHCFGHDWLVRHVLDEPSKGFFGKPLGTEVGSSIVTYRVRQLGEMVANLCRVPGASGPFEQIANGQIESGYAELEVGKLIASCGVAFEFVLPSGTKGEDYDLELIFPNGTTVCADTKCKIEGSTYSATTITNTLHKTRTQLPRDRQCAIFLKIPYDWQADKAVIEDIGNVCTEFFRRTARVVFISIHSDHVEPRDGVVHDRRMGTEFRNPNHDYNPDEWRLFTHSQQVLKPPSDWLQFTQATGEAL